jgi:hypothetical protein
MAMPSPLDDRLRERSEVDHLSAQHEPAGLEPADVEQLGDEAGDAVGVVVDLLEHHALLLVLEPVPAVEHQRRVALHRGERAPQLVATVEMMAMPLRSPDGRMAQDDVPAPADRGA